MIIGQRPLTYFAIANNLLAPSTRAIDLRIFPRTIIVITWNNFKNLEDGSSSMKHPDRCSYTILESPHEDKWGAMVKAWANKVLSKIKMC
jgi:hypothetical protein